MEKSISSRNELDSILRDTLGSASLVTGLTGTVVSSLRYTPYGLPRGETGHLPTPYRYTGQRETGVGFYDYQARLYDPAVGRFAQADTLVPEAGRPQSLNRYSYVLGNPLKYTDPTGYIAQGDEAEKAQRICERLQAYDVTVVVDWGWNVIDGQPVWMEGAWKINELYTLENGVALLARYMGGAEAFARNLQGVQVIGIANYQYGGTGTAHEVKLLTHNDAGASLSLWSVIHEFAHAWDAVHDFLYSRQLEAYTGGKTLVDSAGNFVKYSYGGIPAKGADVNFTRAEDFAESLTTFIMPKIAQRYIQENYNSQEHPMFFYANYYVLPRAVFVARLLQYPLVAPLPKAR